MPLQQTTFENILAKWDFFSFYHNVFNYYLIIKLSLTEIFHIFHSCLLLVNSFPHMTNRQQMTCIYMWERVNSLFFQVMTVECLLYLMQNICVVNYVKAIIYLSMMLCIHNLCQRNAHRLKNSSSMLPRSLELEEEVKRLFHINWYTAHKEIVFTWCETV